MRSALCSSFAVFIVTCLAGPAQGQWTVTHLHPSSAVSSRATALVGNQQVGTVNGTAALWNGSAGSWVSLHPSGVPESAANGTDGIQQVGEVWAGPFPEFPRAALWSGTSNWVNLNPAGATQSVAMAINGGQQVGNARVGGVQRASLWNGSAGSWVDLSPSGSPDSAARGVHAGVQVGYVVLQSNPTVGRASLWTGSAASRTDLHPAGAAFSSAEDVYGGTQVGYATFANVTMASLWQGSSASWTSLHPPGASESSAVAVFQGFQAGTARIGGIDRAVLWSGSAGSWEDLSVALGSGWGRSFASGVWLDGQVLRVSGIAFDPQTNEQRAVVWSRVVPAPSGVVVVLATGVWALGIRRRRSSATPRRASS
jgi:hypothetical protein